MSTVVIPVRRILCWLPDAKRSIGYILKVHTKLFNARVQGCRHETVGSDLGGHRQVCGSSTGKFDRDCVQKKTRRRSKVRFNELYQLLNCSLQCQPLEAVKVLVSIMMTVSLSNKGGKILKLRHYHISRAHFQGPRNSPESHLHQTSRRGSWEAQWRHSWHIGQEHAWNPRCFPHLTPWLCEPELWRVRRLPKRQPLCSIVSQSERRCGDCIALHGDDFVCLSDDADSNTSTIFSNLYTQLFVCFCYSFSLSFSFFLIHFFSFIFSLSLSFSFFFLIHFFFFFFFLSFSPLFLSLSFSFSFSFIFSFSCFSLSLVFLFLFFHFHFLLLSCDLQGRKINCTNS